MNLGGTTMKEQALNTNGVATIDRRYYENNNKYQYIPIEDRYAIFCEKCEDEGITPPTFEEFKKRR